MKISKSLLYQVWLFILMICVIWQDFYLTTVIGRIGATPLFALMPVFVLFEVYFLIAKKKWKSMGGDTAMIFIIVLLLFIFLSFIYSVIFSLKGEVFINGENIIVKSIKQALYYILIILFIRNIDYTLKKIDSIEIVSKLSYFIVLLLFVILIGEINEINKNWIWPAKPNAWEALHSNLHEFYWRVRLLTAESSYTGPVVVFFSVLALLKSKIKSLRFWSIIIFTILYLLYTSSKGFLLAFILALILTVVINIKIKYLLIAFSMIITVFIIFILPYFDHEKLMSYSGSLMTRSTGIVTGLYSIIFNPFGTGGLNYAYLLDYLQEVARLTDSIFGEYANTDEINGWLQSSDDKNISIKSTLGHWALTLGVFGVALYFYMCYRILIYNKNNRIMLFASFFLIFITLLVIPIEMEYPSIFFIIVSQFLYEKNKLNHLL